MNKHVWNKPKNCYHFSWIFYLCYILLSGRESANTFYPGFQQLSFLRNSDNFDYIYYKIIYHFEVKQVVCSIYIWCYQWFHGVNQSSDILKMTKLYILAGFYKIIQSNSLANFWSICTSVNQFLHSDGVDETFAQL